MKIVKLNEIAVCNKDNFDFSNVKGVINYLDTSSITDNSVSSFTKYENYKNIPSRAKRAVSNGTIVYSNVRPILRHIGILSNLPQNVVVSTGFTTIDVNEQKIDPYYLYYVLSQDCYTQYLSKIANSAVSAYPSITVSDLSNLKLTIFEDLSYQKKLGQLLKDIDKKIQNNKKQIETLENLAKTIYDYWFVQFDFPNEEGKPYKSSGGKMVWNEELKMEIPFAWKTGKLKDLFTKKTDQISSHDKGNLSYVPMDRIPIRRMSFGIGFDNKDANTSLILFDKYDVIVGAMRCYFHRVSVAPSKGITRTTSFVLRVKKDNFLSYAYETVNCDSAIDYAARMSIGTQQPYAVWENSFENYPFAMPTHDLLSKYEIKVRKIIDTVINLEKENSYLSALRKTILPLLMNGQVSLN